MSYILYDVALSFSGEDRTYVSQVASQLRLNGVRVFYDEYEKANLWGKELIEYLEDIYKNRSNYVMIFASKSYLTREWTNHERKSALNRAFKSKKEYILPVKLDDTILPGLHESIGYLSGKNLTPLDICDIFLHKIGMVNTSETESFLILYGITRLKYVEDISGESSSLLGGRWNTEGNKVLYLSTNKSLATLEFAVHSFVNFPKDLHLVQYIIPASVQIATVYEADLPEDYNEIKYYEITQEIGDNWLKNEETCILSVPSVIVKGERKFLLNPNHKDFKNLQINKIEDFKLDARLGRML